MKDWIPIIQELIWPIFIGILIFWNRSWFKELLDTIRKRVKEGSEFNIGPGGVSVGQAPVLPDQVNPSDVIDDGYAPQEEETNYVEEASKDIPDQVSVTHQTSFWKMKNGRAYFKIFINLVSDNPEIKSRISKVIYHLHPTFKNPIRVIATKENDFLLKTNGWGEFLLRAEVYIEGVDNPINLNRYIDLKSA